jgi:hypothetical protein
MKKLTRDEKSTIEELMALEIRKQKETSADLAIDILAADYVGVSEFGRARLDELKKIAVRRAERWHKNRGLAYIK